MNLASLRFLGVKWTAFAVVIGVVDGIFLTGVAAILGVLSTTLLGIIAHSKGVNHGANVTSSEAEAWRQLAEAREDQIDYLEKKLAEQTR